MSKGKVGKVKTCVKFFFEEGRRGLVKRKRNNGRILRNFIVMKFIGLELFCI